MCKISDLQAALGQDPSSFYAELSDNTCAVGPIGTPGMLTGPKGRIPKMLGQITWYITSQYVARECN